MECERITQLSLWENCNGNHILSQSPRIEEHSRNSFKMQEWPGKSLGGGEDDGGINHRQGRTHYHGMMVWEITPWVASSLWRDLEAVFLDYICRRWLVSRECGLWDYGRTWFKLSLVLSYYLTVWHVYQVQCMFWLRALSPSGERPGLICITNPAAVFWEGVFFLSFSIL